MPKRLSWPETLRAALDAQGCGVSEVARRGSVGRATIYAYRDGKRRATVPQVVKLARMLGVRPEFLFTGEEPMSADGWTAGMRALAQVDGVEADWDRPTTAQTVADAAAFDAAFERDRKGRKVEYRCLSATVRVMFENLLARVMNAYKLAGRGEDVASAAWRGELAGRMLDYYEREAGAPYEARPASTRAWLVALAGDMERFEDRPVPEGEPFPLD
jgi:transcriptional regulator with XRE-family HTH domain